MEKVKIDIWGANWQFLPSLGGKLTILPSSWGKLTKLQVQGANWQFLPSSGGKLTQLEVQGANWQLWPSSGGILAIMPNYIHGTWTSLLITNGTWTFHFYHK